MDVVSEQVSEATVTIADGRIIEVGPPPEDCTAELDLTGCWATPSLVDMHAHVTFDPRSHDRPGAFSFTESTETGVVRAVQNLTEALRNGICAIRDVGGRQPHLSRVKELLNQNTVLLPDLVTSGEPLCLPDGHGAAFGQHAWTSDEITQVIARQVEHDHEWLKIMNGPELWPEDKLAHIVATAHEAGLRTAVHAFTAEGIRAAVHARATTIEHGLLDDPPVIAEARRNGTAFVPTAYCSWISLRPRFTHSQSATEIGHLDFWYRYLERCRPPHITEGLPLLPGTDAGCAPCTFDDYLDELACFERWGMDPITVLRTATLDAAGCLDRAHLIGSITVGKQANMIITESDPTESTAHLRRPLLVLYRGSAVVNTLGDRWH